MKKIALLVVCFLFSFLLIGSVLAVGVVSEAFALHNLGDTHEVENTFTSSGTRKLTANFTESGVGSIGLSLSKSSIFGWTYMGRCNLNVSTSTTSKQCTYKNQSSGLFKGTIVLNTVTSGNNFIGNLLF